MLILFLLWVRSLFGGVENLDERIVGAVEDPARVDAALEIVERIEELEAGLAEQTTGTAEALRTVHVRHDATRQDYIEALRPLEQARTRTMRDLLEARGDLKDGVNREEWAAIFAAERP